MKKYKCIYDHPFTYNGCPKRNEIYFGDYTWGDRLRTVEELAQKNPKQWELVIPDKWCISIDNMDSEIKDWFKKKANYPFLFGLSYYGNYSTFAAGNFGGILEEELLKKSEELTQYEFKQFIMKEKQTYTLQELVNNPDIVVYLTSKDEWKALKETELFFMTHQYFGKCCYELTEGTYSSSSSVNNPGSYENVTIVTFDQIIFKEDTLGKQELTFPREMLVWDSNESSACKQIVHAYISTLKSPWITSELRWKNAKKLPKKTLPTIGDYKGQVIDKETVKYGCTTVDVGHLSDLYNSAKNCTKGISITSVKLDNGQEVSLNEIAQILDYFY